MKVSKRTRRLELKKLREIGAHGIVSIEDAFSSDLNVYADFHTDIFFNARGARQKIRKVLSAQGIRATIKVKRVGFFRNKERHEKWRVRLTLHR